MKRSVKQILGFSVITLLLLSVFTSCVAILDGREGKSINNGVYSNSSAGVSYKKKRGGYYSEVKIGKGKNKVEMSGETVSEARLVDQSFKKIYAPILCKVVVEIAQESDISVEADKNLLPYIKTEISDDKLTVTLDDLYVKDKFKCPVVYVKTPSISSLRATSGSFIDVVSVVESDDVVSVRSSGAGRVEMSKVVAKSLRLRSDSAGYIVIEEAFSDRVSVEISSAAKITFSQGEASFLSVDASSAAMVDAHGLTVEQVEVSAASASKVLVYPTVSLVALSSSAAGVFYYNKPAQIEMTKGSLGRIRQR